MTFLNWLLVALWSITATGAFLRARFQHRHGSEGWASDAFMLGMLALLLVADNLRELVQ